MNRWLTSLTAVLALAIATPAVVGTVSPAYAQGAAAKGKGKGKNGGPIKKLETTLASLNLTAEQKPKVDDALNAFKAEAKKIADAGGTPQENRQKMRPVRQSLMKKLGGILTPEQMTKLKEATARKKKPAAQ